MIFILILLFSAFIVGAENPGHYPYSRDLIILPVTDSLVFSDKPVLRGSVSLSRKGTLLVRGDDYRVDYKKQLVFFLFSHPSPETLSLSYEKSSFDFKPSYYHRRLEAFTENPDSVKIETSPVLTKNSSIDEETHILLAGTKTIGITLGSGNAMTIDQSLNLNISGEIAKDVEVHAILTDQNMPFQPEGNTESIRELDQVLVEIKTPRLTGALGDLYLTEERTRFGNYRRKIKGAQGEYHDDKYRAMGAFATSEGIFNVLELHGKEQEQGPYRLTSRDGATGIVVKAGTERVTINGKQKKRGQNNDYVIEYGNGQITFTSNCLITADNTIVVEYEYTENEFPKNLIVTGDEANLLYGKLLFAGSFISETDDDKHPLRAPLSEKDRSDLEKAGDTGTAIGSGIFNLSPDSVNQYRGFYVLTPDSHYVYHSPSETSSYRGVAYYDVEFQYVGFGKGNYKDSSVKDLTDHALSGTYEQYRTIYVYTGNNLGNYITGHALPRPESHKLGTIRYNFKPKKDAVFKGEFTGSNFDRNTLSSKGDRDNNGYAFENDFSIGFGKYIPENGPGRFTLSGRQELINSKFTPFTPIQNSYAFLGKWDLNLPTLAPDINSWEGNIGYSPLQQLTINSGGGILTMNEAESKRAEAGINFVRTGSHTLKVLEEYANANTQASSSTLFRTTGSLDKTLGPLTPNISFIGEYHSVDTADFLVRKNDFEDYGAGLSTNRTNMITGTSSFHFRKDRVSRRNDPEMLLDSARAYTVENRLFLDGPGTFSMNIAVVNRRSTRLEMGAWNSYRSDLVNMSSEVRPIKGAIDQRVRYDLSSTLSQTVVDRYEPVPLGTGTHTRDPLTGDYVRKDGGDYIFLGTVADRNSAGENVNSCEISYRLFVYPGKFPSLSNDSGFLKDLTFDTYVLASQDKFPDKFPNSGLSFFSKYIPDFNPYNVSADKSSRYSMELKEDISLDSRKKNLFLKLSLYPRFKSDYQHTTGGFTGFDEWRSYLYSLSIRFAFVQDLILENELAFEWVIRYRNDPEPLYDIFNRRLTNTITWSINRSFSIPLGLNAGLSVNQKPEITSVPYFMIKPGLIYTIPGKGKIEAGYQIVRVFTDKELIFYEMAEGNVPGTTHRVDLSAMFGIGKNFDLDFFYAWEKNKNDPMPVQRGSAQLKAYF